MKNQPAADPTAIVQEMPVASYQSGQASGIQFTLRHYKEAYGIAQPLLVRITGASARTVALWASGQEPSPKQRKVLNEVDRLLTALARIMEPGGIARWLQTPNRAFSGNTPAQVIENGESDRLWRMLYEIESGQPG